MSSSFLKEYIFILRISLFQSKTSPSVYSVVKHKFISQAEAKISITVPHAVYRYLWNTKTCYHTTAEKNCNEQDVLKCIMSVYNVPYTYCVYARHSGGRKSTLFPAYDEDCLLLSVVCCSKINYFLSLNPCNVI